MIRDNFGGSLAARRAAIVATYHSCGRWPENRVQFEEGHEKLHRKEAAVKYPIAHGEAEQAGISRMFSLIRAKLGGSKAIGYRLVSAIAMLDRGCGRIAGRHVAGPGAQVTQGKGEGRCAGPYRA
ncbi:hypothetical protein H5410_004713 [Solanum commersonii]|uniref:Uncharacterized protein n=1 Tax=Solanum commersonii TaxID=4109 RepID=A0A9J6A5Z9_SOLCO|nr:hypothetical protein H5410_004713 [Solanum commersonii]